MLNNSKHDIDKISGILNNVSGPLKLGNMSLNPLREDFNNAVSDLLFIKSLVDEETFSKVVAFIYYRLTLEKQYKLRKKFIDTFPVNVKLVKLDGRSSLVRKHKKGSKNK